MNDWQAIADISTRLLMACCLGGLVGLERGFHGQTAGLRTQMMVSLGAALFVTAGVTLSTAAADDVSRIIQGIAAGVGFLGAGTIVKSHERTEVKGLTTASSVWLAAALGIACGLKFYLLATIATALSLFILAGLHPIERIMLRRIRGHKSTVADEPVAAEAIPHKETLE